MTRKEIFEVVLRGLTEITESSYVAEALKQWRQTYGERGLYSIDFGSFNLDSLARFELVGYLERALDIRVSDDDLVGATCFGHLLDLIEQKLAEKMSSLAPSPV